MRTLTALEKEISCGGGTGFLGRKPKKPRIDRKRKKAQMHLGCPGAI